jgi:hypothetical protein
VIEPFRCPNCGHGEAVEGVCAMCGATSAVGPAVPVPARFKVLESAGRWSLRFRWLDGTFESVAVLALWGAGLLAWNRVTLTSALSVSNVLWGLVGVALSYGWLAFVVNGCEVQVDGTGVHVRHGPLPFFSGRFTVRREQIRQVFRVLKGPTGPGGRRRRASYAVCVGVEGAPPQVVASFHLPAEAEYLHQALVRCLAVAPQGA